MKHIQNPWAGCCLALTIHESRAFGFLFGQAFLVQTLMFSATYTSEATQTAVKHMRDPQVMFEEYFCPGLSLIPFATTVRFYFGG